MLPLAEVRIGLFEERERGPGPYARRERRRACGRSPPFARRLRTARVETATAAQVARR